MIPSGERRACQDPDVRWAYDAAIEDAEKGKAEAVAVCRETCRFCPVRLSCYQDGIAFKARGVWGGIYLEPPNPPRYDPGVCTRGHDTTGRNGIRRSDGLIGCRICNQARDRIRRSKADA